MCQSHHLSFFFRFWRKKKQFLMDLQIRQHSHFIMKCTVLVCLPRLSSEYGQWRRRRRSTTKTAKQPVQFTFATLSIAIYVVGRFRFLFLSLGHSQRDEEKNRYTSAVCACVQNKNALSRFCTCFFLIHTRSYTAVHLLAPLFFKSCFCIHSWMKIT